MSSPQAVEFLNKYAGSVQATQDAAPDALQTSPADTGPSPAALQFLQQHAGIEMPAGLKPPVSDAQFYAQVNSQGPDIGSADPTTTTVGYKDPTGPAISALQDVLPQQQQFPETISPTPSRNPLLDVPLSFVG